MRGAVPEECRQVSVAQLQAYVGKSGEFKGSGRHDRRLWRCAIRRQDDPAVVAGPSV